MEPVGFPVSINGIRSCFFEVRHRVGVKSRRPSCYGPLNHTTVNADHIWGTELFDKLVWTQVNDPHNQDSRSTNQEAGLGTISLRLIRNMEEVVEFCDKLRRRGALLELQPAVLTVTSLGGCHWQWNFHS